MSGPEGPATPPTVRARGLYQAYGRQPALRGVDIAVGRGEAVALLGPNGAGKSTLLKILCSLERPQRGEVVFAGLSEPSEIRRSIGLVAHESLCYADLSARENLLFFAGLYDITDAARRADTLLERVALTGAADRPCRTYSRGMLQRLAVARALVHSPSLLLLDEPFTGLDRQGIVLLAQLLLEEKLRGASMLVVSHDLPAIAGFVDRVLVLARGRIERDEVLGQGDRLRALEQIYDDVVGPAPSAAAIAGSGAA